MGSTLKAEAHGERAFRLEVERVTFAGWGWLVWLSSIAMVLTGCGVLPGGGSLPPAATAAPGSSGCDGLVVDQGTHGASWTVAPRRAPRSSGHLAEPLSMGDGFLVASAECVGYVETSGRLRWTMSGALSAAARIDSTVVMAWRGRSPNIVRLELQTGRRVWGQYFNGSWDTIVAGDGAVLLAGTGFNGAVIALSIDDGSLIDKGLHANGRFSDAVAAEDIMVTAGTSGDDGAVVATDRAGLVVLDEKVAMISPAVVAVTDETVVVQSDGSTYSRPGRRNRHEPATHLAGVDRETGKTRWSQVLEGQGADRGVSTGSTVVVQLDRTLAGVDAETGATRWSRPKLRHPRGFSVEADDRAVVVGDPDGRVEVIEAETGALRWSTTLDGAVERLGRLGRDALLAASATGSFTAFRAADGGTLWTDRGPALTTAWVGPHPLRSVVDANGTVVTSNGLYSLIALHTKR